MKIAGPDNQDEQLRKVLREWRSEVSLPPRFQEQVWKRIESAPTSTATSVWATLAHWVGSVLPRPALAGSYILVLLTLGVTAGWAEARQERGRVRVELGQRYVQMLNPNQIPRL